MSADGVANLLQGFAIVARALSEERSTGAQRHVSILDPLFTWSLSETATTTLFLGKQVTVYNILHDLSCAVPLGVARCKEAKVIFWDSQLTWYCGWGLGVAISSLGLFLAPWSPVGIVAFAVCFVAFGYGGNAMVLDTPPATSYQDLNPLQQNSADVYRYCSNTSGLNIKYPDWGLEGELNQTVRREHQSFTFLERLVYTTTHNLLDWTPEAPRAPTLHGVPDIAQSGILWSAATWFCSYNNHSSETCRIGAHLWNGTLFSEETKPQLHANVHTGAAPPQPREALVNHRTKKEPTRPRKRVNPAACPDRTTPVGSKGPGDPPCG
jgi:hypothetical protein